MLTVILTIQLQHLPEISLSASMIHQFPTCQSQDLSALLCLCACMICLALEKSVIKC